MSNAKTDHKEEPSGSATYKRLWREELRQHWPVIVLILVATAISAAAAAGYSKLIQLVITAFEERQVSVMWWGPAGVITLTILKGGFQYLQATTTNRLIAGLELRLRGRMFRNLVFADLARLSAESPAALATRFSADITLIGEAAKQVIASISAVLLITFTFIVMLSIDWQLTIGLIAVFTLALAPVSVIGRKVRTIARSTQTELAQMTSDVAEGLSGIRMVRAYQLEEPVIDGADGIFQSLQRLKVKMQDWQARVSPVMEVLAGAAVAVLVFVVGWRMSQGAISLGDFMGLLTGLGVASTPARRMGGIYAVLQAGRAALDRVNALFDDENTVTEAAEPVHIDRAKGHIRFDGVGFRYPDGTEALSDVDLEVPPGAKIAFVGRSGAGKSTVFNLLPRLYDATEGQITLDGVDLRQIAISDLRNQIAVVSQDSVLLSGTVAENIAFGKPGTDREAIEAAAKAAAAHDFIMRLPQGYDTPIGPAGGSFSGGERQRLSIARAILRDAPILLLDEPTSALDAESEAMIRTALDRLSAGRTTLVIAHRLATILDADRIVVMDRGRVVDAAPHDDLLERGGLYADLYRLQFQR